MLTTRMIHAMVLGLAVFVVPAESVVRQACAGCFGTGGTSSSSGGDCGGMVQITVDVENGTCKWFRGIDPLTNECRQTKGCKTTVTRTWSGLPAEVDMDYCILLDGQLLCLEPQPNSGSGSGSSTRNGPSIACTDNPDDQLTFSVSSGACDLSAEVTAVCSACYGDL